MKRLTMASACGFLLILLGLAGWSAVASAERQPELLGGELWQAMSPDARVAFVWGIGNIVELERAQNTQSAGSKSLISFLARGLAGKPINEVVHQVDLYYETHPDQIKRPVVDAIFQAIVFPALKAEREDISKVAGGGQKK